MSARRLRLRRSDLAPGCVVIWSRARIQATDRAGASSTTDQPVTFINVLDVEPDRQQELLNLLTRGAEEVIRHRPGFISLTLLASRDGRRVINLTQWANADSAQATQTAPDAADYAARIAAIDRDRYTRPVHRRRRNPLTSAVHIATAIILAVAAAINIGIAVAVADLARAGFVLANSAEVRVPESWLPQIAGLKGAGGIGLLLWFLHVPVLPTAGRGRARLLLRGRNHRASEPESSTTTTSPSPAPTSLSRLRR